MAQSYKRPPIYTDIIKTRILVANGTFRTNIILEVGTIVSTSDGVNFAKVAEKKGEAHAQNELVFDSGKIYKSLKDANGDELTTTESWSEETGFRLGVLMDYIKDDGEAGVLLIGEIKKKLSAALKTALFKHNIIVR